MTDPFAAALDAYLDTDHPVPHALLVHGPWGAGKSFALRTYFDGKDPPVWISLFGLSTVPDIQRRVREAALPQGSGHLGSILGFVAGMEGGSFAAQSAQKATQGLLDNWADKLPADRPFVFDDLERFEGDLSAALGYLNLLTEETGRRVVVVANEAELLASESADWKRRAEKLIGRRVTVRADAEAVLDGFVKGRPEYDPVLPILTDHRDVVLATFARTKLDNLRSLSWALENLSRVAAVLDGLPFDVPETATAAIVTQVVAFTVEHRGGRIGKAEREMLSGDMALVREAHFKLNPYFEQDAKKAEAAKSDPSVLKTERARTFLEAHPAMNVSFHAGYLDYGTLYALEASGIVDDTEVAQNLKAHGVGNVPSDVDLLLHWHSLEADDLTRAIAAANEALSHQAITDAIQIGRFAFVALSLESLGDKRLTGPDAETFFRRYIIEMARAGRMIGYLNGRDWEQRDWIRGQLDPRAPEKEQNPRRAAVLKIYARLLITLDRAAEYRRWRDATSRAKAIFARAQTEGATAIACLDAKEYDPFLQGYPVLNAVDPDTFAKAGSYNIAALERLHVMLRRRDEKAYDAAKLERPFLGRALVALRERVGTWPAPIAQLHLDQITDWTNKLHKRLPFPDPLLPGLNLSQSGNNSDPSP